MPRQSIIINQSHYKGNGVFQYDFPSTIRFSKAKISLYQLAMYNSTFNIRQTYGNNTLSIKWIDDVVINITIPDGYYSYSDINLIIQNACTANNWYVLPVSNPTAAVYFVTTSQNAARYSGQINVFAVPSATTATGVYTKPAAATWVFPTNPKTPVVTFSVGLGKIFGFKNQLVFPTTSQTSNFSYISDITPVISPVYSYLITCNLLNSDLSLLNQLFCQVPINAGLGGLINFTNPQAQMLDVQDGTYKYMTLTFLDQNQNPLTIVDTEVTIILLVDF
jgi:hypothetical protein